MTYHIRYRAMPGADLERLERFIELYEPHAVADDTVLRAITLGHPMVCPIVSMGARIGRGRN